MERKAKGGEEGDGEDESVRRCVQVMASGGLDSLTPEQPEDEQGISGTFPVTA